MENTIYIPEEWKTDREYFRIREVFMLLRLESFYNIVSMNLIVLIIVLPVLSWKLETSAQNSTTLNGHYCKTLSNEVTNDTSSCMKNANGTAGCTGNIRVWAAQRKCTPQSLPTILCNYTCTPIEVSEYTTYQVAPRSTTYGQLTCLLKNGAIGAVGAACILGVVAIFVGAEIESAGAATIAATIAAAVIVECGETAGTAFLDWWANPCCHTYCIQVGSGTPSTDKMESCN
jgi:hypothetical protein